MKTLAEQFIGKDCLIYTIPSNDVIVKGIITQVTDNGITVDYNGKTEAVNLEYVTRIREWPKNSKGKKKNTFL